MVQIDYSAYLLFALCILLLPVRWVLGAVFAAAVHELFHLATICIFRVGISGIRIHLGGIVIQTDAMETWVEACCALSGPIGSFSVLLFARQCPEAALIALCQGIFNLLPIYPLDGGRFLRCIAPVALCKAAEVFTWIVISGLGVWLCISGELGICACMPGLYTGMLLIHGKFPCKE